MKNSKEDCALGFILIQSYNHLLLEGDHDYRAYNIDLLSGDEKIYIYGIFEGITDRPHLKNFLLREGISYPAQAKKQWKEIQRVLDNAVERNKKTMENKEYLTINKRIEEIENKLVKSHLNILESIEELKTLKEMCDCVSDPNKCKEEEKDRETIVSYAAKILGCESWDISHVDVHFEDENLKRERFIELPFSEESLSKKLKLRSEKSKDIKKNISREDHERSMKTALEWLGLHFKDEEDEMKLEKNLRDKCESLEVLGYIPQDIFYNKLSAEEQEFYRNFVIERNIKEGKDSETIFLGIKLFDHLANFYKKR